MKREEGKRRNRKKQRASGIYKLDPLFRDVENNVLVCDGKQYYVDGKLDAYLIVSVPETTSRASAMELEKQLAEVAKKPVLVVTHNMAFLRATLLTGKERAELAKIIEKATSGGEEQPDVKTDASI